MAASLDSGTLVIQGNDLSSYVQVDQFQSGGEQYVQVWETNYYSYGPVTQVYTFRAADITAGQVRYFGDGGDDTFTNNTTMPTYAEGGDGNDVLTGGFSNDTLIGDDPSGMDVGNDALYGRTGFDDLYGGPGHDALNGGRDGINDRVEGGAGYDTFYAEYVPIGGWWGIYFDQPQVDFDPRYDQIVYHY
jgi:hypothetical protein